MWFYRSAVLVTSLVLMTPVVSMAQTAEDAFPPDYLPEDFLLPFIEQNQKALAEEENQPTQPAPTMQRNKPVSFNVQQLPRTPSNTVTQPVIQQAKPNVTASTFTLPSAPVEDKPLSATLWQGAGVEHTQKVLEQVVAQGIKNQTPRKLLHRILLSDAAVPTGTSDVAWLAVRAKLLLDMHLAEDAYRLLHEIQPAELAQNQTLAEVWTLTTLLSGKHQRACGFVKQQVLNADVPFWRQALLVCQAVQGEVKALELTLNLLDGSIRQADPSLITMLEAILSGNEFSNSQNKISHLQAVLYASFPDLIEASILPQLPDMMLRRVLTTEQLDKNLRLQAGELLVNQHRKAQDVLLLTKLYDSFQFDVEVVKNPVQSAQQEPNGAVARALLWQAASLGQLTSARAQALQALWERAEADGLADLSGVLLPRSRNIQPHPNLAWFAPSVVEAALRVGEKGVVQSWWDVLQANKTLSQLLTAKRFDLLLAVSFSEGKISTEILEEWWKKQPTEQAAVQQMHVQQILAVLDALDIPAPVRFWQQLYTKQQAGMPYAHTDAGHVWLRLLATHLEQKHEGAALLMLLAPMAQTEVPQLSSQTAANIVTGLRFLGFEREAYQLALEALLPIKAEKPKEQMPTTPAPADAAGTEPS